MGSFFRTARQAGADTAQPKERRMLKPKTLPLSNHGHAIDRHIRLHLPRAAGPGNLHAVDLRVPAKPEMQPQIVLRKVAPATPHLRELRQIARYHPDLRS